MHPRRLTTNIQEECALVIDEIQAEIDDIHAQRIAGKYLQSTVIFHIETKSADKIIQFEYMIDQKELYVNRELIDLIALRLSKWYS